MVVEAHLEQAALLKKVVDAMKDLCKDVNFDCSEKDLQLAMMMRCRSIIRRRLIIITEAKNNYMPPSIKTPHTTNSVDIDAAGEDTREAPPSIKTTQ